MRPAKFLAWLVILVAVRTPHILAVVATVLIGILFHISPGQARVAYGIADLLFCVAAVIAYYRWRERVARRVQSNGAQQM